MPQLSREELTEVLKEFLVEKLGISSDAVTDEASFQDDLGADSLDLVEVIMEMEDRFGLKIADEDAKEMTTVADALDYLADHQPPDGYTITNKDEGGAAGVRKPAPAGPSGNAGGTTAEEAVTEPAQ